MKDVLTEALDLEGLKKVLSFIADELVTADFQYRLAEILNATPVRTR